MQENKMLDDIAERLNAKTIHEVRRIARAVGARAESSQKSSIMQAVLAVAQGTVQPRPPSKRGAPPKSEETDEKLVADIKTCNRFYSALKAEGKDEKQFMSVSDSEYGRKFASLTHVYPEKRISISGCGENVGLRIIDFFVPLVLGQRVLVTGDNNSGKTELIKNIARGIYLNKKDIKVVILLVNARPEEVTDFNRCLSGCEFFCTTFDMPADVHASTAMRALGYAKTQVETGGDVVLLSDGLFCPYIPDEIKRQYLYCACNAEEGGSLTLVCAISRNADGYGDYASTAGSEIVLSKDLSAARVFPAIDVKKSYLSRENVILTADEIRAAKAIRDKYSAEEIVNIFKSTETNEEIIKKY